MQEQKGAMQDQKGTVNSKTVKIFISSFRQQFLTMTSVITMRHLNHKLGVGMHSRSCFQHTTLGLQGRHIPAQGIEHV